METYWGLHADQIQFGEFWTFLWGHRSEMMRYLDWAAEQSSTKTNQAPRNGGA